MYTGGSSPSNYQFTRIAFGDSYTYVQGTEGHQNYSFIGDQLNFDYDAQALLNNKIVQNQVRRQSSSIVSIYGVLICYI
jgi:hypothetical protein